jgi:hypothetical protein
MDERANPGRSAGATNGLAKTLPKAAERGALSAGRGSKRSKRSKISRTGFKVKNSANAPLLSVYWKNRQAKNRWAKKKRRISFFLTITEYYPNIQFQPKGKREKRAGLVNFSLIKTCGIVFFAKTSI